MANKRGLHEVSEYKSAVDQ